MALTKHRASWSLLAMAFLALTGGCSGGEDESGAIESADSATPAGTATLQTRSLTPPELLTLMEEPDGPLILDVRSPQEYTEGHIPGRGQHPVRPACRTARRIGSVPGSGRGRVLPHGTPSWHRRRDARTGRFRGRLGPAGPYGRMGGGGLPPGRPRDELMGGHSETR